MTTRCAFLAWAYVIFTQEYVTGYFPSVPNRFIKPMAYFDVKHLRTNYFANSRQLTITKNKLICQLTATNTTNCKKKTTATWIIGNTTTTDKNKRKKKKHHHQKRKIKICNRLPMYNNYMTQAKIFANQSEVRQT